MKQLYLIFRKWVVLLLVLISASSFAQTTVTGVVRDEAGPLPGVTILIKGTTNGVQTNANGAYSIKAAKGNVLKFSSVGYDTKEVTVGDDQVINITLAAGSNQLKEVTVTTSFGIKRQDRSLGYATSTVSAKEI